MENATGLSSRRSTAAFLVYGEERPSRPRGVVNQVLVTLPGSAATGHSGVR